MRKSKVLNICKAVAQYDFEKFAQESNYINKQFIDVFNLPVECMGFKWDEKIAKVIFSCPNIDTDRDSIDFLYLIEFDMEHECILNKRMFKDINVNERQNN